MTDKQGRVERSRGENKGIQSVEIGAALMDILIESRQAMRLKDLSAASGLSSSKARMYLVSLIRAGLIEQDSKTGLYGPGSKSMRLGMIALGRNELYRLTRALVQELGAETGFPVLMCAWDGSKLIILRSSDGPDTLPINIRMGATLPLWGTASGALILAHLPEQVSSRLLRTDCPPSDHQSAMALLEQCRRERISVLDKVNLDKGVYLTGYSEVAVPIFGRTTYVEFTISLLIPNALSEKERSDLIGTLYNRAVQVSSTQVQMDDNIGHDEPLKNHPAPPKRRATRAK